MIESEEIFLRRRRLPHQDVVGHPIFITGCLDGSIPAAGLREINLYREKLETLPTPDNCGSDRDWELIKHKKLFSLVDHLLDHKSPVNHLSDAAQATIVRDAFYHFAEERYELLAFVVMPSHHHWLFLPNEDWAERAMAENQAAGKKLQTAREIISHSVQSYTATMCNRARSAAGQYWQHETFDHWARDDEEAMRIANYIEQNPVKAGLVNAAEDYVFSSARVRQKLGLSLEDAIPKIAAADR